MDNWRKFQYHLTFVITDGGTKKGRSTGRLDVAGQGSREFGQANPSGR
jgi:hypothetical protein